MNINLFGAAPKILIGLLLSVFGWQLQTMAQESAEKPVELHEVTVSTEITGTLALTTTEMLFYNPNARVMEKALEFPLLEGQTVVRFAMDVNGALREAVPVEKNRGQEVFETIVRRGVDPGLVEKTEGNNYRARIYPIEPKGYKRVVIGTLEEIVPGGKKSEYRLALDYGELKKFELKILVQGPAKEPTLKVDGLAGLGLPDWRESWETSTRQENFDATGVVAIQLPALAEPKAFVSEFNGESYFYIPVEVPSLEAVARPQPDRLCVVWDASGSGADRNHEKEIQLLEAYVKALPAVEVILVRLRNDLEMAGRYLVTGGDISELRREIERTIYDGGTNLGAFSPDAVDLDGVDAVVLFSDGLGNFGSGEFSAADRPVFAVSSAVKANASRLRYLADRSGGAYVGLLSTEVAAAVKDLTTIGPRVLGLERDSQELAHLYPEVNTPVSGIIGVTGILRADEADLDIEMGIPGGQTQTVKIRVEKGAAMTELAARAWATSKIRLLEVDYAKNRNDILRTGQEFGIVTRDTSLIVLDSIHDYVEFEIRPPKELREEYDRLMSDRREEEAKEKESHVDHVVRLFEEKQLWYDRNFPKDAPPKKEEENKSREMNSRVMSAPVPAPSQEADAAVDLSAFAVASESYMAGPPAEAESAMELADESGAMEPGAAGGDGSARAVSIQLQQWTPDAGYIDHFGRVSDDELYDAYLEERPGYLRSTAFYLDCYQVFLNRKQPELGLRILSNLAEMELENHAILRVLAYRLQQSGHVELAMPIFERVLRIRGEEPQSYRDLALACAEAGQHQRAVDLLWSVVSRPWDGRFPEIELIVLAEMNAIIATSNEPIEVGAIDPRLRRNLPLELRVVLTWDADNTDMDLWVTDPNGEKCYYSEPLSYQGGRMSRDFTRGYGPEEYSLKVAKPGTYKVQANYYGSSQQDVMGPATIQLSLQQHYGTRQMEEQRITLRLETQKSTVDIGTFEVKP